MSSRILVSAALALTLTACDDATGPEQPGEDSGLQFRADGALHNASGTPSADPRGSVLNGEFAVARADSVGGFAVIGYEPTGEDVGDLFVIQAPRAAGTYECGEMGTPCHGRFITGVRDGSSFEYDDYHQVVSGTLVVSQIGPDRLKATFQLTLEPLEAGDPITLDDGVIDVPYFDDEVTDGAIACLLSLVGIGEGPCRS